MNATMQCKLKHPDLDLSLFLILQMSLYTKVPSRPPGQTNPKTPNLQENSLLSIGGGGGDDDDFQLYPRFPDGKR